MTVACYPMRELGEISVNHDSRRVPVKAADRKPGPYPYYGAQGIVDHVSDYIFDGVFLLVAEDGENLRSRKEDIAFTVSGKFWVNNHAHILTGTSQAATRFLAYAVNSRDVSGYLTGSTIPKLSQRSLRSILIPCPPLAVQEEIVSLLGALDDKINLNRRMSETLEAMAQVIFKDWFVDFGPTHAKAEGRAPYLASELWDLFPDALDDEGKPVGWRRSDLGSELEVLETGKRPRGGVSQIKEGIPSIGAESIVRVGEFNYSKTKFVPREFFLNMARGLVTDGDVLVYKDGGKPGELHPAITYVSRGVPFPEFCINEHVFRVRARFFSQPLLYCLLSTDSAFWQMRENATGVAQPGLNKHAVRSISFTLPDSERVLRAAEDLIDPLVDKCNDTLANSRTLAHTRDLLLPKLMSGEIRLRDAGREIEAVA